MKSLLLVCWERSNDTIDRRVLGPRVVVSAVNVDIIHKKRAK